MKWLCFCYMHFELCIKVSRETSVCCLLTDSTLSCYCDQNAHLIGQFYLLLWNKHSKISLWWSPCSGVLLAFSSLSLLFCSFNSLLLAFCCSPSLCILFVLTSTQGDAAFLSCPPRPRCAHLHVHVSTGQGVYN